MAEQTTEEKEGQTFIVGEYILRAPAEHVLPKVRKTHPYFSENLARVVKHLNGYIKDLTVLDIGANIGDSVALIRSETKDVAMICIEGDDDYYQYLIENTKQFDKIELIKCFLGEHDEKISAKLITGDGSLRINNNPGSPIQIYKLDSLILRYQNISKAKMIKIDTDGYDLKIIRGGLNFIKTAVPVIFFEYDSVYFNDVGEDGLKCLKLLFEMGYHKVIFYDNYGRMLAVTSLDASDTIESLILYIKDKKGKFQYYDMCIFHESHDMIAASFFEKEKLFHKSL
jgi:FkbM family methyltransferase